MWYTWGESPHSLSDTKSVRFVQKTVKWYRQAAREKRQICWPSLDAAQNHLYVHEDVLGAINNLLLDPHTVKDDMGLRHLDLPAGEMRTDIPICFDYLNNQTQWLERHMPLWMTLDKSGKPVYHDLINIRKQVNAWGGPLPRLLLGMLREASQYACHQHVRCARNQFLPGPPIQPKSYTDFLDDLKQVIRRENVFCISLGTARVRFIPDTSYYWFVAGGKQATDSQRWTFDPLIEVDEPLAVVSVNASTNGSPQICKGSFQEKNDYSHRRWDEPQTIRKYVRRPGLEKSKWINVQGSSQGGSDVAREAQVMAQAGLEVEV
ncbi:hypothetical protein CP533_3200 [Ophiocordyceps camponoti-saundersi (nom. inval.)]|nr:hypothetical protein CP533_3200 [Ophiocordyceps camponoti-saundersi (nom. inval.)]